MATPGGIWRPPQWSKPAMVALTVQPQNNGASNLIGGVATFTTTSTAKTTYVFDAVFSLEHEQRLEKTQHPVQTGADISSHAYLLPARLCLFIGMSDAMDAYANGFDATQPPYITPFSGSGSKSISAYQELLSLQQSRVLLTVTTRLRTYTNMLITGLTPREDSRTIAGLRMRVDLEQVPTATLLEAENSARPNDTDSTGLGDVNTTTPSAATQSQFGVPKVTEQTTLGEDFSNLLNYLESGKSVDVPGAGTYSSVNTNSLQQLPSP